MRIWDEIKIKLINIGILKNNIDIDQNTPFEEAINKKSNDPLVPKKRTWNNKQKYLEHKQLKTIKVTTFFRWYNFWIGLYINKEKNALYFCPLPMIGLKIDIKTKEERIAESKRKTMDNFLKNKNTSKRFT